MKLRWYVYFVLILSLRITTLYATDIPDIPVYKTATPLTIDGELKESVWQSSEKIPINLILGKKDVEAKDATGYYMLAWDEHYLYIGYDWYSETRPQSDTTGKLYGPEGNKRLEVKLHDKHCRLALFEFFIDINYDDYRFWEIHHNDKNHFSDIFCLRHRSDNDPLRNFYNSPEIEPVLFIKEYFIKDDGQYTLVSKTYEKKANMNGYAGYSAELRLPLKGLGVDYTKRDKNGNYKLEGVRFRIFGVESRSNRSTPYCHSARRFHGGWFHNALKFANPFVFDDKEY